MDDAGDNDRHEVIAKPGSGDNDSGLHKVGKPARPFGLSYHGPSNGGSRSLIGDNQVDDPGSRGRFGQDGIGHPGNIFYSNLPFHILW
jgi:hypothetical protein